ncbi:hypothetical protein HCA63_01425 [Listeria booriae]|uniref:Uncharacterized protein n=1 Tax=Listeria booriae TaxID=1552123 RepID=A0A7X1CE04_9LIST|nr:hypothetical protein [Listeria booriae]MBC1284537.1 hypothetical protein [Listeria booriae]MBC1560861.1 hypothetical protein [Listeria booriae]MBC1564624.1 hypothetical protein [Listeria booriae]MBC1887001.1 hypothetical protein [Listeria booriae]MBC1917929.1 hypothetical protein [Listeria booriae]
MFQWIVLAFYIFISGMVLLFCKKYGFRIVILLCILMLWVFEDTPKEFIKATFSIGASVIMFATIVLIVVALCVRYRIWKKSN